MYGFPKPYVAKRKREIIAGNASSKIYMFAKPADPRYSIILYKRLNAVTTVIASETYGLVRQAGAFDVTQPGMATTGYSNPGYAIDDNTGTRWAGQNYAYSYPQIWTVNLGAKHDIASIRYYPTPNSHGGRYSLLDRWSVSNDGTNWTQIRDHAPAINVWNTIYLRPMQVTYQYFKYQAISFVDNCSIGLVEVELFESIKPLVAPVLGVEFSSAPGVCDLIVEYTSL